MQPGNDDDVAVAVGDVVDVVGDDDVAVDVVDVVDNDNNDVLMSLVMMMMTDSTKMLLKQPKWQKVKKKSRRSIRAIKMAKQIVLLLIINIFFELLPFWLFLIVINRFYIIRTNGIAITAAHFRGLVTSTLILRRLTRADQVGGRSLVCNQIFFPPPPFLMCFWFQVVTN